jgi:hypothetical protein
MSAKKKAATRAPRTVAETEHVNPATGEIQPGVIAPNPNFDPSRFTVKKSVTLPFLKVFDGKPYFWRFLDAVKIGKDISKPMAGADGKAKKMDPAHIARIFDHELGREMEVIIGAVLKGILDEDYEDDGYVGKTFRIVRFSPEGKRYKTFEVAELAE